MQKNDTDALHHYMNGAVSLQGEAVKTSGLLCSREHGGGRSDRAFAILLYIFEPANTMKGRSDNIAVQPTG